MAKQIRNILVVWMLTGIWHGAHWNYVLWGNLLWDFPDIGKVCGGEMDSEAAGLFPELYTMFIVVIGWVLFKCEDLSLCISYLRAMFGGFGAGFANSETVYLLYNNAVLFVVLILGSTMLPRKLAQRAKEAAQRQTWVWTFLQCVFYAGIFVISVAYLVDATYNPFLYFRF